MEDENKTNKQNISKDEEIIMLKGEILTLKTQITRMKSFLPTYIVNKYFKE